MFDRVKSEELVFRIDEVLYYVWDPMCVSGDPCARGEYTTHALTMSDLVMSEDIDKIADHLTGIESDSMGLSPNKDKNRQIAEQLVRYKYAIDEGLF